MSENWQSKKILREDYHFSLIYCEEDGLCKGHLMIFVLFGSSQSYMYTTKMIVPEQSEDKFHMMAKKIQLAYLRKHS